MSEGDGGGGGLTGCQVVIIVLVILGCVGLGPCAFLQCDDCGVTIDEKLEESSE